MTMIVLQCSLLVYSAAGVAQLVEQLICNQQVGGSSPFASSKTARKWPSLQDLDVVWGRCPSGQREQTVNLPAKPTEVRILPSPPASRFIAVGKKDVSAGAGIAQGLEHQPSKLRVAGSNPVSRSILSPTPGRFLSRPLAVEHSSPCSSGVERFLGKEEVTGSIPVMGSRFAGRLASQRRRDRLPLRGRRD